jgi:hypothetical protein
MNRSQRKSSAVSISRNGGLYFFCSPSLVGIVGNGTDITKEKMRLGAFFKLDQFRANLRENPK